VDRVESIFRMIAETDAQSKSGSYAGKRDYLHTLIVRMLNTGEDKTD